MMSLPTVFFILASSLYQISLQISITGTNEDEIILQAGEALRAVLSETSPDSGCSYGIFTDGSSSPGALRKVISHLPKALGVSIFEFNNNSFNVSKNQLPEAVGEAKKLRGYISSLVILVVSNDPNFLTSFARSADDVRLMVWSMRILVVTSLLSLRDLKHLMENLWVYSMFNTMVINSDGNNGSKRCDIYSYFPYTPTGSQIIKVALWTQDYGLRPVKNHQLFPEKYLDFYGSPVNVTVWPFMPYFMALEENDDSVIEEYDVIEEMIQNETKNGSGTNKYTGRDYVMLEAMASVLNFTIRILPVANWDEVIDMVIERVAFMSPMRIAILPHLLPYLDFSTDFEPETLTFAMAKPGLKPRWQGLLYPLRELVWMSTGVLLLMVLFTLYLISNVDTGGKSYRWTRWWTVIEEVLGSLFNQGLTNRLPRRNSVRLAVWSWLVFAFVLGSIYRGNLTAFLTLPKYPPRVETLQQLVDAEASMLIPPDTIDFYNGFKQSPPGPYKDISKKMAFVPSIQNAFPRLLKENSAYMYERRNLDLNIARHYTRSSDGSTSFYVAKENIWPGFCAWPIIRDAPFRPVLDRYIRKFVEAGLVDQWGDEVLYKYRSGTPHQQRGQDPKEPALEGGEEVTPGGDTGQENIKALTVIHLQGPLFLLLLSHMVSSFTFAGEMVVSICSGQKNSGLSRLRLFSL